MYSDNNNYYCDVLRMIFCFFHLFYINWNSGEKIVLFPYSFIYFITYKYKLVFILIFVIQRILVYILLAGLFCCVICFSFGQWEFFQVSSCVFWTCPFFSGNTTGPDLSWIFSAPELETTTILRSSDIFNGRRIFTKQDLGVKMFWLLRYHCF